VAVELEFLERQVREGGDQTALLIWRDQVGLIEQALGQGGRGLNRSGWRAKVTTSR